MPCSKTIALSNASLSREAAAPPRRRAAAPQKVGHNDGTRKRRSAAAARLRVATAQCPPYLRSDMSDPARARRRKGGYPMFWSVNIGSIAGTAIRIHFTFLLFLVWIFAANWVAGGPGAAWGGLVFMLLLFACVLAHEFGHIFTARALGVPTPDVTLLPIGGVARLERIPEKPSEELLVAIAGPLVNVAIAAALIGLAGANLGTNLGARDLSLADITHARLIDRLAAVNIFLAVFNMIPAFPMDGGRVLRALLAIRLGHVRATEIAATIGQLVAFALGFLGLFGNPLLIFIAIFVYLAASSEAQLVAIRAMSRGVPVSAAMMTQFATLAPDEHIDAAVETLLRTSQNEFPVVDGDGRLAGLLDRGGMIRALKERGPDARVADAMVRDIPTVGHRRCLEEAFRILQEKSAPAVGIVDMAGRLVGLVTSETVGEMLMVREALPKGVRIGPWSRPTGPVTEPR
jgi:Zn-dependent protease/CBS domain-containing protein